MKVGAGRGPGTFCSFLHHWLPGQECVMSAVVVTGLQECGHQEAAQGPGRALGHRPGAQGASGRDVGSAGRRRGEGWARPEATPGRKGKLTGRGCVFPQNLCPKLNPAAKCQAVSKQRGKGQRTRPKERAQGGPGPARDCGGLPRWTTPRPHPGGAQSVCPASPASWAEPAWDRQTGAQLEWTGGGRQACNMIR